MRLFRSKVSDKGISQSVRDYQALVRTHLRKYPKDRSLALARSIGAPDMESFRTSGDGHVAVLFYNGLKDGMSVYDLGCGCGRTAQALKRSGWTGSYIGADVVPEYLTEIEEQCPGYETVLNYERTIVAPDGSLDMVFNWSVFTHLLPAESYAYIVDSFRALKPGGQLLFSFLELEEPAHDKIWNSVLSRVQDGKANEQLDAFLHRDWIRRFARDAGYEEAQFTDGTDATNHPPFWQSLAILRKPETAA